MTITVKLELDNAQFEKFSEIEKTVQRTVNQIGCELMRKALEAKDLQLMKERDTKRFRHRGMRKTCVKTKMGVVEYQRRIYEDCLDEKKQFVFLLDQLVETSKIGAMSEEVCLLMTTLICENTYRNTAETIMEMTGLPISAMSVWNTIQQIGMQEQARVERYAKLAEEGVDHGCIETEILYEEADGIYLPLQGESRKEHGKKAEMKVGIAYDGVTWTRGKDGKKRRTLDNKTAYASFSSVDSFRVNNEGVISSRFQIPGVKLRIKNGDGAGWIQKAQEDANAICVLDEFHRNKKITECVRDPEFAKTLRTLLYDKKIDDLLEVLQAQIDSVEEDEEKALLKELYQYYDSNKDSLLGYYDRGIPIPPTRNPGVIHHARLGSMESNIFTLIGNRMKGGRCVWSIAGGNNLALLLCLYHTTGFERVFSDLIPLPPKESAIEDLGRPLHGNENPERIGHGYEYYNNGSVTLSDLNRHLAKVEISNLQFM